MHVSIEAASRHDLSPWPWSGAPTASVSPYPGAPLRQGSQGQYVRVLQQRLKERGKPLAVDGFFGPHTHQLILVFQQEKHLKPDGIVGPKTWLALWAP
jgi:peptidoglycan hydrolase-like protein with peptidoglycan-binding domain